MLKRTRKNKVTIGLICLAIVFCSIPAKASRIIILRDTTTVVDDASGESFKAHLIQINDQPPQASIHLTEPLTNLVEPLELFYQDYSGNQHPLPLPKECLNNLLYLLRNGLSHQENENMQCKEFASSILSEPQQSSVLESWLNTRSFIEVGSMQPAMSGMPFYVFSANQKKASAGYSKHMGIYLSKGLVLAKLVTGPVYITDILNFKGLYMKEHCTRQFS